MRYSPPSVVSALLGATGAPLITKVGVGRLKKAGWIATFDCQSCAQARRPNSPSVPSAIGTRWSNRLPSSLRVAVASRDPKLSANGSAAPSNPPSA